MSSRPRRPPVNARRHITRWLIAIGLTGGIIAAVLWLRDHPQDNPYARLSLAQPVGWATGTKLMRLANDPQQCRALLNNVGVGFTNLPAIGAGACRTSQRTRLEPGQKGMPTLVPAGVAPSCAVTAAMVVWQRDVVAPLAMEHLGRRVVRIDHFGSYNCRRIAGSERYSEHATGNAIDIAAFVLSDGRRVTLADDWNARDGRSAFLRAVRDQSCALFSTVLSPDYNRAHADHFHFDQAQRIVGGRVCR